MRTPVQVGTWPQLGLDGGGKPVPGPVLVVAWRQLSWKEYNSFRFRTKDLALYADIYDKCLVKGPPLAEVPAGIAFFIGKQEIENCPFSGEFASISKNLQKARARVGGSWLLSAQAVIASVLHYSLDDVTTWPADVFFERLAQAEQLTGTPLNPEDPKHPAPKGPRKKGRPGTPQPPSSADNKQFTFTQ